MMILHLYPLELLPEVQQFMSLQVNSTGCPKKIGLLSIFEFLGLGGVYLDVKINSKNFGNKKNIRLLSKILS